MTSPRRPIEPDEDRTPTPVAPVKKEHPAAPNVMALFGIAALLTTYAKNGVIQPETARRLADRIRVEANALHTLLEIGQKPV